jgi:hypothetical protein
MIFTWMRRRPPPPSTMKNTATTPVGPSPSADRLSTVISGDLRESINTVPDLGTDLADQGGEFSVGAPLGAG